MAASSEQTSSMEQPVTPPEEMPFTVDELIRSQAKSDPNCRIISYPSEGINYVDYTFRQLDVYAFRVAQRFAQVIPRRLSSTEPRRVVGLLGPSTLDYFVSALALSKLGMTVLYLSTRISDASYLNLLNLTDCDNVVVHPTFQKRAEIMRASRPTVNVRAIASSNDYLFPVRESSEDDTWMSKTLDPLAENQNTAWIIHSSGSTGLPKPIFQTHAAALRNYTNNFNMKGFITLPFFHANGISSVFRSITSRKQIHMYNASLPMTGPRLLEIMKKHDFEIFYGVPYALKLLSETPGGVEELAKLKIVMYGGSSCPQELGDRLVQNGVKLISHYGTTETGQLMTSFRDEGDMDWNYVRPSKALEPFIRWEDHGEGHYELVVLDGWPSKVATNRPDGAYATKDIFVRHPRNANAFKWTGRVDDTIVLLNGEKAIPIQFEHTVRQHKYVSEAVVFGQGKPQLGLFIVVSEYTEGLSDEEVLRELTPLVDTANREMPAYGEISLDMVKLLPKDYKYPRTDKDTVIRAAFYNGLKDQVEQIYEDLSRQNANTGKDMSEEELKNFLRQTLVDVLRLEDASMLSDDMDFFAMGMDSLQALRAHTSLVQAYNTHGHQVGQNILFEKPTLNALTSHLYNLSNGGEVVAESVEEQMSRLVDKYSKFKAHQAGVESVPINAVLCTGATGSLGAHVVATLVQNAVADKVYCLVRATSQEAATDRVNSSLKERSLYEQLDAVQLGKIVALPSNLGRPDLGLEPSVLKQLRREVTTVIHLAWAVNFNWGLESFEQQHISGLHNLIQFCLDSKRSAPAALNFGSSVSAVSGSKGVVPEAVDPDFCHAQDMGYARSKLVAENICSRAAQTTGVRARIMRIGQIVGDRTNGFWNSTEAIPLMTQAAVTIGALPSLDENPRWLPVDVVASAIVDLSFLSPSAAPLDAVFHVTNPRTFHWTHDYLPALKAAGLDFECVSQREWVRRLRASEKDPVVNPPVKLVEFYASKYDRDDRRPELDFRTDFACAHSASLRSAPVLDEEQVRRFVKYWRSCW